MFDPSPNQRDQRSTGLVYHAGGLGDFVLSLPAVHRVVGSQPGIRWSFWGPTDRRGLLPGFDRAPPALVRHGHTLWGEAPSTEVRKSLGTFETVLAFGGREPPTWVRHARGRVLPLTSFPRPDGPWVPVHQLRQLDRLGVVRFAEPWLPAWREQILPVRRPAQIVVHPGSGDNKKNLPLGIWEEVIRGLRGRFLLPVTVVLGPAEVERGGWEDLGDTADHMKVCEGNPGLLDAIGSARVYLGNDAGPTHLAAALGVPTVAVFGPSNPHLWRPLGPRVRVVCARSPCAPCTTGEPIACQDAGCLGTVEPSEVIEASFSLLEP